MKVLFVCQGNVGRSQAAMEYYNQKLPGQAESAGTAVDKPGEKIGERFGAASILSAMQEHGIDMSDNERTPLTEEQINKFGKVIVMADPQARPPYLADYPNVEYWDIEDAKDVSLEKAQMIRDQIKARVDDLIGRTQEQLP